MNFISATASIIGSSHQKLYYNNQDAYEYYQDSDIIVGVVADGCGSGSNSEVGAQLGVNFVYNFCLKYFSHNPFDANLLKKELIDYLKNIVINQGTEEELEFIENYLFFTLFGFVVKKDKTHIFHSGDGFYILNDKEVIIEQNNRPNYIAKNLFSGNSTLKTDSIETSKLERLMVSTDGLIHLNDKFEKAETIQNLSKLSDLFENEDYFTDISSLPKLLIDLSTNKNILKDDTTFIMIKRNL